jgi:hypothetical protein
MLMPDGSGPLAKFGQTESRPTDGPVPVSGSGLAGHGLPATGSRQPAQ